MLKLCEVLLISIVKLIFLLKILFCFLIGRGESANETGIDMVELVSNRKGVSVSLDEIS